MKGNEINLTLGQVVIVHPTEDSSTWYLVIVANYRNSYQRTHVDVLDYKEGKFFITGEEYLNNTLIHTQDCISSYTDDKLSYMEDEYYSNLEE